MNTHLLLLLVDLTPVHAKAGATAEAEWPQQTSTLRQQKQSSSAFP
jgi:hypothetical protein